MIDPFKNVETIVVSFLLRLKIFNKTLDEEELYLEKYFKMLQKHSKIVIFIQDIPFLDFDPIEQSNKGIYTFEIGVNATKYVTICIIITQYIEIKIILMELLQRML